MGNKTDFKYPGEEYVRLFKDFFTDINGPDSLSPDRQFASDTWLYNVFCSKGSVLEKAGFALLDIAAGSIYDAPGSLKLFESLIYPTNPKVPGLIFVVNQSETEVHGKLIIYCIDLIIQDGSPHEEEKKILSDAIDAFCEGEGHIIEERNAFPPGRLLAGTAADCGLVNYFEEKDIPFLDRLLRTMLPVYKNILEAATTSDARKEDYEQMNRSRARIMEWITDEDVGVIIARENNIPFEIIESYAFPPLVR